MRRTPGCRIATGIVLALCALVLTACAARRQARSVEYSGFLADYSKLMSGMDGEANRIYHSPRAKNKTFFKDNDKIVIDPVAIYRDPKDDNMTGQKDLDSVANNYYTMLVDALKTDYQVVRETESNTLRLAVVITDADKDVAIIDAISTVWPAAFVTSTLFSYAADAPGFSGDITMETRLTDAQTGEILVATVDRRLGAKNLSADLFDEWQTVNDAIAFWSKRQRYELCKIRGATDCVAAET